jgi:DNA polymerase-3 subunit epsilon
MVADAPFIEEILPSFFSFLEDDIFVAHNASFDHGFISNNAKRIHNHDRYHPVLCTRKLANRVVSDLPNKKLATLCQHFSIVNTQAHRAMADVLATTEVLRNFIDACATYHTDSSPVGLLDIQKRSVGYGKTVFGGRL